MIPIKTASATPNATGATAESTNSLRKEAGFEDQCRQNYRDRKIRDKSAKEEKHEEVQFRDEMAEQCPYGREQQRECEKSCACSMRLRVSGLDATGAQAGVCRMSMHAALDAKIAGHMGGHLNSVSCAATICHRPPRFSHVSVQMRQ